MDQEKLTRLIDHRNEAVCLSEAATRLWFDPGSVVLAGGDENVEVSPSTGQRPGHSAAPVD